MPIHYCCVPKMRIHRERETERDAIENLLLHYFAVRCRSWECWCCRNTYKFIYFVNAVNVWQNTEFYVEANSIQHICYSNEIDRIKSKLIKSCFSLLPFLSFCLPKSFSMILNILYWKPWTHIIDKQHHMVWQSDKSIEC